MVCQIHCIPDHNASIYANSINDFFGDLSKKECENSRDL